MALLLNLCDLAFSGDSVFAGKGETFGLKR